MNPLLTLLRPLRIATAVVMWAAWAGASAALPPLPTVQLAPGVHVHQGLVEDWQPGNGGDVSNTGYIVGSRCVAVIDSGGSPDVGRRLRAAIALSTPLPVCYVITTHAHPDHLLGHAAFADFVAGGARYVAHARYRAALTGRERAYRNTVQRDFGQPLAAGDIVFPDIAVERELTLDLGDRQLLLRAWPTAHTDNDLTVWDAQTRTLFLGDLLFIDHLPVLDGRLLGWLKVMDELQRLPAATVVPGHGAPSRDWPAAMAPQRNYMEALRRDVKAALAARVSIQQAVDRIQPAAGTAWRLVDVFQRRNVTAAYAELEWEE